MTSQGVSTKRKMAIFLKRRGKKKKGSGKGREHKRKGIRHWEADDSRREAWAFGGENSGDKSPRLTNN